MRVTYEKPEVSKLIVYGKRVLPVSEIDPDLRDVISEITRQFSARESENVIP